MPARLLTQCRLATMTPGGAPYGLVEDAAIAIDNGRIAWAGASPELPSQYTELPEELLGGRLVTPALIDCHTHLVHGGDRAREFEMRLNGVSYEEIARAGGGINSTVVSTRAASEQELIDTALIRLDSLIADGVAVVEIKSGYGLTVDDELRMLRVARRLGELRPVKVVTTWLAAHAMPRDFNGDADQYINDVVIAGLERAAAEGLVDAVDGYCENIAFSPAQIERVFQKARELGLPVKLHAEQLSDQKGAVLAARYGALSADHLEHLAPEDAGALAAAGSVAVLLPGAFYALRETKLPPIEALRSAGVPMAVATDCNPGTSPLSSLLVTMNMACVLFRLTPEEALAGATSAAAKALGLSGEYGTIEPDTRAELAVWNVKHPAELSYRIGRSPLERRISAMETA
ncbi:imidazolonepropionase [Parvularcula marina]|uniref:Imidazolonepropionase n=1 Tax=Parvularcula marina TaxID=2292771 RepID=A0A371RI83_9PROT|nr:imidazolonepropionase [Parvularcula marina]RFB05167.1 imidazolonepropionase [Parvularcula marina]